MSYSFNVKAATKGEAIEQAAVEFTKVVDAQPTHTELDAALAVVTAFVQTLEDDPTRDVAVSVSGSVSWRLPTAQGEPPPPLYAVGINVSVYNVDRS